MSECPVRNPKLAWREIDGEIVIISPDDSQVHELNETASLVWKHSNGTESRDEIAARIAAEFDVTLESAQADVIELIAVLDKKHLLLAGAGAKG
ncbi:MAG: PqqD family protein [Candidatus Acidiferrales bacterium]